MAHGSRTHKFMHSGALYVTVYSNERLGLHAIQA
jgi:hypothetical protein